MIRWTSLTALFAAGALAACDRPGGPAGPAEPPPGGASLTVSSDAAPVTDAVFRVVPMLGESAALSLGPALRALVTAVERADVPAVRRASVAAVTAIEKYDAATGGRHAADVEAIRLAVAAVQNTN